MNKHRVSLPHPALCGMALTFACFSLLGASACGSKDADGKGKSQASAELSVVSVTVHTVERRSFRRDIDLDGNLDPAERVLVAPSIPGVIRTVTKRAGDKIQKGELLVEVDPREVYVGTIQLRVSLASAKSQVRAANEVLARLDEPLGRLRRLFKEKAISKTELDQMEIPYVRAQAERDAGSRIIQNVQSELGIAYSKLSETKLTAPFDGYVVRRLADPGEMARPFPPTVVLVVTRNDPLYVQAEVNEEDVGSLRKGEKIPVTLDALPGQDALTGELEEIIPFVNPMTRSVTVRVRLPNPDGSLMPGMSAHMRLSLVPQEFLAVPEEAMATEALESRVSVFVVDKDGKARERRIRFGRSQDGWVSVLSGLRQGDRVVRTGHDRLLDGTPVKVEKTPAEAPQAASQRPGGGDAR